MTEDQLEQEALGWLAEAGYATLFGPDIAPDGDAPERGDYRHVLLPFRLREAICATLARYAELVKRTGIKFLLGMSPREWRIGASRLCGVLGLREVTHVSSTM